MKRRTTKEPAAAEAVARAEARHADQRALERKRRWSRCAV
jgi:hypothetical protein